MKYRPEITIGVKFGFSMWDAIKMRMAGKVMEEYIRSISDIAQNNLKKKPKKMEARHER